MTVPTEQNAVRAELTFIVRQDEKPYFESSALTGGQDEGVQEGLRSVIGAVSALLKRQSKKPPGWSHGGIMPAPISLGQGTGYSLSKL